MKPKIVKPKIVEYEFLRNGAGWGYGYFKGDKCPEKVIKKDLKLLVESNIIKKV